MPRRVNSFSFYTYKLKLPSRHDYYGVERRLTVRCTPPYASFACLKFDPLSSFPSHFHLEMHSTRNERISIMEATTYEVFASRDDVSQENILHHRLTHLFTKDNPVAGRNHDLFDHNFRFETKRLVVRFAWRLSDRR